MKRHSLPIDRLTCVAYRRGHTGMRHKARDTWPVIDAYRGMKAHGMMRKLRPGSRIANA